MELTQEHFDKQISELNGRLDNMATKSELKSELAVIRSEMVTKSDLKNALEAQTKTLEDYTDQVAETIIEAIDSSINKINTRLDGHDHDVKQLKGALNLA